MPIDLSNKNSYQILGVSELNSNEEITARYNELKAKYSEERFLPGTQGNDAAQMLGAIEQAYVYIMTERKAEGFTEADTYHAPESRENDQAAPRENADGTENDKSAYAKVDAFIKAGRIDDAQNELDGFSERSAEWHYLQAVVYYKRNWGNECKKQLEIALRMEPDNKKYKDAYEKLLKEMEFKSKNFTSGSGKYEGDRTGGDYDPYDRQMGGNDCLTTFCQCLACNMLLNCCCNCR